EEITKTTLGQAAACYAAQEPRGEYVLVMAGAPESAAASGEPVTLEAAVAAARALMEAGNPPALAAKQAAKGTEFSKGEIYKELISGKES
ncbi:16S rRNA (cytidine(1402)-2'-O)-methyltransferase, partial [bacterium]|nr:16S rRNA (cytidine(1402)-2'-O)-methyltransferase [bacterium]